MVISDAACVDTSSKNIELDDVGVFPITFVLLGAASVAVTALSASSTLPPPAASHYMYFRSPSFLLWNHAAPAAMVRTEKSAPAFPTQAYMRTCERPAKLNLEDDEENTDYLKSLLGLYLSLLLCASK